MAIFRSFGTLALRVFPPSKHLLLVIRRSGLIAMLVVMARAQDPAILQIKVVEGDGAVYATGSRATRGIAIQVTDETGRPVDGTSVSFRLPDEGPSGSFVNGSKTE